MKGTGALPLMLQFSTDQSSRSMTPVITKIATKLIRIPALNISAILILPVPKTIALGGVEIGRMKAAEAARAVPIRIGCGGRPRALATAASSGIIIAARAVFEVTPVAKVTNLKKTMEELKKEGLWFVCADMGGEAMYDLNLTGPIGLVIGNEGEGVSRLVKETCDFVASIPMKGDIDSLNASVATGVLAYEIVRQRLKK